MPEAWRICPKPGCPTPVPAKQRYCDAHMKQYEQSRGTKAQRGYGKEFQAERRMWVRMVATGEVTCWRCLEPIHPGDPFDLGHDDHNRDIIRGPEHPRCNRSAAGKSAHQ